MTEPVLQQGIDLMVYGMSSVFLFLVILITLITVVSTVIDRFFLDQKPIPEIGHVGTDSPLSQAAPSKTINPKLLAVIQNAIDQHRGSQ
ncbi:MAG: OadG family protein [Porticoccus sp.]|nr:OadG family protein [Porticoccus sp.]